MGGSGGGFTQQDNEKLKELAQKRMREVSVKTGKKNCFISFAHDEDGREVNALRGQAKNENSDVNFNDHSVKKPFNSRQEEYIKRQIRDKLRHCSTMIVYCTEASAKSAWVNWEVETGLEMGKKVICMYQGTKPTKFPPAAAKAIAAKKMRVIPWSAQAISKAMSD